MSWALLLSLPCLAAEPHPPAPQHLGGFKLMAMTTVVDASQEHARAVHAVLGGGPFYEQTLVPGWLDVEIASQWLQGTGLAIVPLELIVKKPFHLSHAVTAYAGVGAAMDLVMKRGEAPSAHPAALAVAGTYVWMNPHVGLDAEVNYGRLLGTIKAHEVAVAVGPVFHW